MTTDYRTISVHCDVCGERIELVYTLSAPVLSSLMLRRWSHPHAVSVMMDVDTSALIEHHESHRASTSKTQLLET